MSGAAQAFAKVVILVSEVQQLPRPALSFFCERLQVCLDETGEAVLDGVQFHFSSWIDSSASGAWLRLIETVLCEASKLKALTSNDVKRLAKPSTPFQLSLVYSIVANATVLLRRALTTVPGGKDWPALRHLAYTVPRIVCPTLKWLSLMRRQLDLDGPTLPGSGNTPPRIASLGSAVI